ncbi:MBOAT family O-acyltransferase [Algoriphagus sp.]|uniref:MBOAT family O-acyltransferase n=1 Tax=Algoriphagus sp. TaxID=1872435 RepID=UPI00391B48A9
MLFNSVEFAVFLPLVFALYWILKKKGVGAQNIFLLAASYFFYGWWDWRFLFLILFSTLTDFYLGKAISAEFSVRKRKLLLTCSILINLGLLGFFKYFNFFIENFTTAFTVLGGSFEYSRLDIVLPVGISFYTFQTLSYTIDVYKRKIPATNSFISFATYVSFFPQLVAGPIERASNLLPQFEEKRRFDYLKSVDGLRQILWGLFKKIVIADNCAESVNIIFNDYNNFSGITLFLGGVLFAFQIYGDFSGYSDIAIGTARLFGFNLKQNFAFPYFSRDIAEFWRRWHISLSTWFRDYLYIPLGGSKGGLAMKIRNTFIIFLVSGFWHGANWTFLVWGFLNALYFLPLLLRNKNRINLEVVSKNRLLPTFREVVSITMTFFATVIAWIIFRSESITEAYLYLFKIFSSSPLDGPEHLPKTTIFLTMIFIVMEWFGRENEFGIQKLGWKWNRISRLTFYYILIGLILVFSGQKQEFIYFQF